MPKEKFMDRLRTYGMSIKVPLTGLVIAVAILPLFLQAAVMLGSFNQGQLDARTIEIQNQCVILSNKMTRSGYMTAEKKNATGLDSQMQAIADVYNGRIVIVNTNFRVVTDTFNLATGKYYISEEVIKCFKGENSSHYNKDMQYLAQTIPVYDPANEKNINGVIVVTASTENILSLTDKAMGKSNLFLVCMCLVLAVLAAAAVHIIMRPFKNLQMSFDRVAQGDLDADISEDTYRETRQLSHSVQKSLSKLKAVDQSRQEFVSNVSHELKTPIALIQGYAEGLTEGMAEEKESRDYYCEVIMDEAGKMNKMVKQLLTLTALEFGNEQTVMERFNLTELIQGVISAAGLILQQKQITVEFSCTEPLYVWGDEFKIEEVVTNYFNNALNHAEGDKKVIIRAERNEEEVRVTVFNTGRPIPEADIPNLWTKFFKVDKARTREYGGSGIGLSIVKAIMDSHHKKYGVRNLENGVEFWFTLDCSRKA